uniref:Uncharacterized protein n=1 Tax=Anguilla anguilla TaxID=7936 RepID=A0A0E9QXX7_ANGAN
MQEICARNKSFLSHKTQKPFFQMCQL